MGVTINFQELLSFENAALAYAEEWNGYLNDITEKITAFCFSESLSGEGAESMKLYMSQVHGVMISQLQCYLQETLMKITNYVTSYFMMDADAYAIIDSFTLSVCNTNFTRFKDDFDGEVGELKAALVDIEDLYSPPYINQVIIDTDFEDVITMSSDLKTQIEDFDALENLINAQPLEDYHLDIYRLIMEATEGRTVSIDNYQPGGVSAFEAYEAASCRQAESLVYVSLNEEGYQQGLNVVVAANQYVADVEEQKNKAIINWIEAGVCFVAGVSVIVATWGAATPVVVGGITVGGGCIGFGVAETVEGCNGWYYYLNDDGTSVAFNPIRDTIFEGNEEAYALAKDAVLTTASLYKGGVDVAAKASQKILVREGGEWVLKSQTDDVGSYVAVSVIESYGHNWFMNEVVNPAATNIVVNGYEALVGEEVEAWQKELIETTIGYGTDKVDGGLHLYNGNNF